MLEIRWTYFAKHSLVLFCYFHSLTVWSSTDHIADGLLICAYKKDNSVTQSVISSNKGAAWGFQACVLAENCVQQKINKIGYNQADLCAPTSGTSKHLK